MASTAACFSVFVQISSKVALSTQSPSHLGHSWTFEGPTNTDAIFVRQRGQGRGFVSASSIRFTGLPQWEQNLAPSNTRPKQRGQATVARRAPQCSHREESAEAGAPHIGQFSVSAGILSGYFGSLDFFHQARMPGHPTALTVSRPFERSRVGSGTDYRSVLKLYFTD